ncbi:hypothetical protein PKHYL_02650 [Psychrobacter sp. KH172YL61]|nr:hypothetical protein PKHYL_02650 [Psychrobacter sp. KH172YL61]
MTQSPNPSALPQFSQLTIQGEDAEKFLQGQLTCDVTKLGLSYQAAAICNLKGRIEFGIWIKNKPRSTMMWSSAAIVQMPYKLI